MAALERHDATDEEDTPRPSLVLSRVDRFVMALARSSRSSEVLARCLLVCFVLVSCFWGCNLASIADLAEALFHFPSGCDGLILRTLDVIRARPFAT